MNSLIKKFATLATLAIIAASAWTAAAIDMIDMSESFLLERNTILGGGLLKVENGYLLKTGVFKVIMTSTHSDYGETAAFEPVNGKPIMMEQLYEAYKAIGAIPNWVRSSLSYTIGIADYVTVAVKGKDDPNPSPIIHQQPQSVTALLGADAVFSIDASPKQNLTYQWWLKKIRLPGATGPSLTLHNVTAKQAGVYRVEISTGGKSLFSSPALLKIALPVVIKTGPKSQTVVAGKPAVFRVSATGTAPFTYQWYRDGTQISGANKSTYSIPKVQAGDGGKYVVRVSNGLSWAESAVAVLTVKP